MRRSLLMFMALSAMTMSAVPGAVAADIDFSYDYSGDTYRMWRPGKEGKRQAVNVAIKVADPALTGSRVTGFSVYVPGQGATDFKGWLSSTLKVENREVVADICEKEGTVGSGEAELLRIVFDEPYVIPESGVYVGYSFRVNDPSTDFASNPIAVVQGDDPDGLFVYATASHFDWKPLANTGLVSAMHVDVDGDFPMQGVSVEVKSPAYSVSGSKIPVSMTVRNRGTSEVSDIEYSYRVGETLSGTGKVTLPKTMGAVWNLPGQVEVELPAMETVGSFPLTVTVEKVNGQDNGESLQSAQGMVEVFPFVPKNRPLVEEFTGLWCGFCPRSYVETATLAEKFGEDFVCVSYHSRDLLSTVPLYSYPFSIPGDMFPCVSVNRTEIGNDLVGNLEGCWQTTRERLPLAEVEVSVEWTDDAHTALKASSTANFVRDCKGQDFKMAYFLIADGLTDPNWVQDNYYSEGEYGLLEGKYADLFNPGTGSRKVKGLVYNDVILSEQGIHGVEPGYPEDIKAGDSLTHSFTFDIPEEFKCIVTDDVITKPHTMPVDKKKLRVVAALLDSATGHAVNSDSSEYSDPSGIGLTPAEGDFGEIEGTEYYDITGRRLAVPSAGVCIRVDRYAGGRTVTSKFILRK